MSRSRGPIQNDRPLRGLRQIRRTKGRTNQKVDTRGSKIPKRKIQKIIMEQTCVNNQTYDQLYDFIEKINIEVKEYEIDRTWLLEQTNSLLEQLPVPTKK